MPDFRGDVNRATVRGTVADPAVRALTSGNSPIVTLRVQTEQRWWIRGEERTATEFHTIVIFDRTLQDVAMRLRKGDRVHVEGHLQTRRIRLVHYHSDPHGQATLIVLNAGSSTLQPLEPQTEGTENA